MWPTIQAAVKQVQAGVFTAQDYGSFSTMTKGGATLAPFHDWETKLPADVVQIVKDKEAAIMSGDFRVPVNESTPVSE
jgi:basic membrane lipoprotein Med (substrate-binding protein (PBP1-ABC) superfamily)